MTGIIHPSYQSGFASPQRGDLAYPQLWRGCVGAWSMGLGATGLRLYDHSGYGKHGTLTNMDPGTDWVASGGGMALDFDGSNDYVTLPIAVYVPVPLTFSAWVYIRSFAAYGGVIGYGDNSGFYSGRTLGITSTSKVWANESDSTGEQNTTGTTTLSTNTWIHIAAIFPSGGSFSVWLNGVEENSNTNRKTPATAQAAAIGTRIFNGTPQISFTNGLVDDARITNRALTPSEIKTLAQRRGIAYETKRLARGRVATAATSRRNNMLMGCGF